MPSGPEHASPPDPAAHLSGNAGQGLLDAIREELERHQAELAVRDQRIAQIESELREARAALEKERVEAAKARSALEQKAIGQVNNARRRLTEQALQLREAEQRLQQAEARETALREQVQSITAERGNITASIADVQRRLGEQPARSETLEGAAQQIPVSFPAAAATASVHKVPNWRDELSRLVRGRLVAAGVVLAGVCVLTALIALGVHRPPYRVTSLIAVEASSPASLAELADVVIALAAPAHLPLQASLNPPAGVIELTVETKDARGVIDRMNTVAGQALAEFARRHPLVPASQPAAERTALMERVGLLESRLVTSRPAGPSADSLLQAAQAWSRLRTEQEQTVAAIARATARASAPAVDESLLQLDPARVREAMATDPRLRADSEMLTGFQGSLRQAISGEITRGTAALDAAATTTDVAVEAVGARVTEDVDAPAAGLLKTVQETLRGVTASGASLKEVLAAQNDLTDPVAVQAAIETGARTFIDDATAGLGRLRATLEALGQGGDQPTKRLVLHNNVAKDVRDASGAIQSCIGVMRRVIPADNVELASSLRRVGGLQVQVREAKARIEAALRHQMAVDLRARNEREAAAARDERDRLATRRVELEGLLRRQADTAFALLDQVAADRQGLLDQTARHRDYAETLNRLVVLESNRLRDLTGSPAVPVAHYMSAKVFELPVSMAGRLGRAFLVGLVPLVLAAMVVGGILGVRAWRQSRRDMHEYTRMLEEARGARGGRVLNRGKP